MWSGTLLSCIILIGDFFSNTFQKCGYWLKNVILAMNNYLMPSYKFPKLHTGNGKTHH